MNKDSEEKKGLQYIGKNSLSTNKKVIKKLIGLAENIKEKFNELVREDRIRAVNGIVRIYEDQNRFMLSILIREPFLEFYHSITGKSPYLDFGKNSHVERFYTSLAGKSDEVLDQEQQEKWFAIRDVYNRVGKFYDYLNSFFYNRSLNDLYPSLSGQPPNLTNYSHNISVTFELKCYGVYYICPICNEKTLFKISDYASIYCINEIIHPELVVIFDDDFSLNVPLDDGIHLLPNNDRGFLRYLAIHKRAKLEVSNFLTIEKSRFLTKQDNVVVSIVNRKIVGYLSWNMFALSKCIRQVYVLPNYRRKGIAKKLFEWVIRDVSEFTVEMPNNKSIGLVNKFKQSHKIYYIQGS